MSHLVKTGSRTECEANLNGYPTDGWSLSDDAEPPPVFAASVEFLGRVKEHHRPDRPQVASSRTSSRDEDQPDEASDGRNSQPNGEVGCRDNTPDRTGEMEQRAKSKQLNSRAPCSSFEPESTDNSPSPGCSTGEDNRLEQPGGSSVWDGVADLPMAKCPSANGTAMSRVNINHNNANSDRISASSDKVTRKFNSDHESDGSSEPSPRDEQSWTKQASDRKDCSPQPTASATASPRLPNWCSPAKPFSHPASLPKTKRSIEWETDRDSSEWRDGLKPRGENSKVDSDKMHGRTKPLNTTTKHEVSRQQRKGTLSHYPAHETESDSVFQHMRSPQDPGSPSRVGVRLDESNQNQIQMEGEAATANMTGLRLGQFGATFDPNSQCGLLPLGANNLAAAAAAAAMSPLFQRSIDEHNQSSLNPTCTVPFSTSVTGQLNTSLTSSTKSMDTCFPPMLAAAAVAALTGGRFAPSGSSFPSFNPMFSSASVPGFYQTGSLADMQSAMGFDRMSTTVPLPSGLTGTTPMSSADMAKELLFSPMRAMYNTSKSLFDTTGDLRGNGATPPPPPLSASTSPQAMLSGRGTRGGCGGPSTGTVGVGNYCGSVDDGRDEPDDDGESMEGGDQGIELEESMANTGGHQWTFEEQFKQLYVLSDEPKRKEFLDELFAYMQRRGTPVNRIPIMAKQVLDLYELFQLVVARGGLVEVINKKLWREITKGLNLPSSITSAAFTLRTQYMKYLYPYECDTLGLSTPSELQAAIDGNRREARRSSYSFDYPIMMPPGSSNRSGSPANLMGPHSTSCSSLTANAINAAVAAAAMGQSLPNQPGPFGPGIPSGLHHLATPSMPFGPAGLGFHSQLNQFHPLLGLPSMSLGGAAPPSLSNPAIPTAAAFSAAQQLVSTSTNPSLFASSFMNPMAGVNPFPLGAPAGFPPFSTGLGSSDESLLGSTPPPPPPPSQPGPIASTNQPTIPNTSACLLNSIGMPLNSGQTNTNYTDTSAMAAAAAEAAASLFGTGFPHLPGAFATTPPQIMPGSDGGPRTAITNTTSLGGARDQDVLLTDAHSPTTSTEATESFTSSGPRRTQHMKHSTDTNGIEDGHRHAGELSPGPLNLAATEDSLNSAEGLRANVRKHARTLSPDTTRRYHTAGGAYARHDEKKRPLSADEQLKRFAFCDSKLRMNETETSTDGKLDKLDAKGADERNKGLLGFSVSSNASHRTRSTAVHASSPAAVIPTSDAEELLSKNAAQAAACHQIWAAAAAAAAATGFNNNMPNLEDMSNTCDPSVDGSNLSPNLNSLTENVSSRLNPNASHTVTPLGKRTAVRGSAGFEGPNSKIARSSSSTVASSPVDSSGKRFSSNTALSGTLRKGSGSGALDYRRTTADSVTNATSNMSNTSSQNQNALGVGSFALATQSLRIQTQSGGPMGLPQNAMVVTMEMGNVLYQGVLFGQFKR